MVPPSAATAKKGANAASKSREPKGGPGRNGPRHARDIRLEHPAAAASTKSRRTATQAKLGRGSRPGWAEGVTRSAGRRTWNNGRTPLHGMPTAAAGRPIIRKTGCFAFGGVVRGGGDDVQAKLGRGRRPGSASGEADLSRKHGDSFPRPADHGLSTGKTTRIRGRRRMQRGC